MTKKKVKHAEPFDNEKNYVLTLSVRVGFYGHDKQAADVLRIATNVLEATFDDVAVADVSGAIPDAAPKALVR